MCGCTDKHLQSVKCWKIFVQFYILGEIFRICCGRFKNHLLLFVAIICASTLAREESDLQSMN